MQINLGDASLEQVLERLLAIRSNLPWGGMLGMNMLRLGSLRCWCFSPQRMRRCPPSPHLPPPLNRPVYHTADGGGGGGRVVYSTRTASRVHVLFFLVYMYCLRCVLQLCVHNCLYTTTPPLSFSHS